MATGRLGIVIYAIGLLALLVPASAQDTAEPQAAADSWPYTPHPVTFCARMAAFGLVERPTAPLAPAHTAWECGTRLMALKSETDTEATTIFTQIRGKGGRPQPPDVFRLKVSELDEETVPMARGLVTRVIRSAARSYGYGITGPMVRMLQTMENTTRSTDCLALRIQTEFGDSRRHNIWLAFHPACSGAPSSPSSE